MNHHHLKLFLITSYSIFTEIAWSFPRIACHVTEEWLQIKRSPSVTNDKINMVLHLTLMINKSIHLVAKDIRVVSYSIIVHKDASGGRCWERVNDLSQVAKQQHSCFTSQSCGNDATFLPLKTSFLKTLQEQQAPRLLTDLHLAPDSY